jgi:uncharacterized coiled-coil protein SlyX
MNNGLDLVNEKITILSRSHSELRERVDGLSQTVAEHTLIINKMSETQTDVRQMVDLFGSMKQGMTVLGWLGNFAKWCWPLIAFGIAITVYMRTGRWSVKD